ncbi:hypothetical protein [Pandoraea sputorum]|uniref:hypothetical protein n=1 Tax=Pandoraea sputorum TaxID=93222 RepID=UPI002F914401
MHKNSTGRAGFKDLRPKSRFSVGDVARIKRAWNSTLEGRLARVRRAYSDTEWVIELCDGPALSLSEDRSRFVVATVMVADDWDLDPVVALDSISLADRAIQVARESSQLARMSERDDAMEVLQ